MWKIMVRGWESQIQFQPSLLLPLVNVRRGEMYTANSGVAVVSHVHEAKAPFGVGDVVITLWFQEKYTEKLAQRGEEEVPPWVPTGHPGSWSTGQRVSPAPDLWSLYFG